MLTLYFKPTCVFCQQVIDTAFTLKLDLNLKDASFFAPVIAELIELGGKNQVPFLVDTDKKIGLYEAREIIKHLDSNYSNSQITKPKAAINVHQTTAVCKS